MQSRAQRRRYGEPVIAAFPEDSFRARHTRGLECELVSIACSAFLIRSPRVHVPLSVFSELLLNLQERRQRENGPPISALQLTSRSLTLAPRS